MLILTACVFRFFVSAQGLGSGYCFNFVLSRRVSAKWANTGAYRRFLFLVPLSAPSAGCDHSGHVRLGLRNRTDAQVARVGGFSSALYSLHPLVTVRIHLFLCHILQVESAVWPRVRVCSTGMALVCLA